MAIQQTTGVVERASGTGIWWIRYTDAEGKRRWEKCGRRNDAINILAKRKHEKLLQKKLPESLRPRNLTFGELAARAKLQSAESHSPRHRQQLSRKLDLIGKRFNGFASDKIRAQDIKEWLLEQGEVRGWSPATRNRYKDAFSYVLRNAVENSLLSFNPASLVRAKAEHNERSRFLSEEEEARLLAVLRESWPEYVPAFLVSIHTGMRAGEQFQLKWRDVSMERRIISLRKTKTGKPRHIPINAVALQALEQRKKLRAGAEYVFYDQGANPQQNYRRWFGRSLKEARVNDYSWHCNRHTFASRLVMVGVDLRTVAELMGHSSIQMTMRYAHLAPQHNRAAVDLLVQSNGNQSSRRADL